MSLIEGLAAHLAAAGVGTYRGDGTAYAAGETALCLEFQPEAPDATVTLTTYPSGTASDSKLAADSPRLQVRTRHRDQATARQLCQSVYDELHGLGPITLPDGTRLTLSFGLNGGPYWLARDDNGRAQYVTNFQCDIVNRSTHRQ